MLRTLIRRSAGHPAGAATSTASLSRKWGSPGELVRGFRIDAVENRIAASDHMVAIQQGPTLFSFLSLPGASGVQLSEYLLESFQPEDRCFHAVFGRRQGAVPCDFAADLDLSNGPHAPPMSLDERHTVLASVLTHLHAVLGQIRANPETVLLLQSGCERGHKYSYHLHVSLRGAAFADVIAMRGVALAVNERVSAELPHLTSVPFDAGVYRPNGMMRMAFAPKFVDRPRVLRPYNEDIARLPPNELLGTAIKTVNGLISSFGTPAGSFHDAGNGFGNAAATSPAAIMAHSLVSRPDAVGRTDAFRLIGIAAIERALQRAADKHNAAAAVGGTPEAALNVPADDPDDDRAATEAAGLAAAAGSSSKPSGAQLDGQGRPIPSFLKEEKKWQRFAEAVTRLRKLPSSYSENYDSWIRIGLSLHAFGHDDHILDEWVQFSSRSRSKFSIAVCKRYWEIFARREDPYNWRRGYYYITRKTQVHTGISGGHSITAPQT